MREDKKNENNHKKVVKITKEAMIMREKDIFKKIFLFGFVAILPVVLIILSPFLLTDTIKISSMILALTALLFYVSAMVVLKDKIKNKLESTLKDWDLDNVPNSNRLSTKNSIIYVPNHVKRNKLQQMESRISSSKKEGLIWIVLISIVGFFLLTDTNVTFYIFVMTIIMIVGNVFVMFGASMRTERNYKKYKQKLKNQGAIE